MNSARRPVMSTPQQTSPNLTIRALDHHDSTTDNPIFIDQITDQKHYTNTTSTTTTDNTEARSNKSKNETHTHASRSCGARREPWRARWGTAPEITFMIDGAARRRSE